jgi:cyanophycinase
MPGSLIIAGGAIGASEREIYSEFISAAGGKAAKLAVFPADNVGEYTRKVCAALHNLGVLPENIVIFDGDTAGLDGVTGCWLTDGSKRALLKVFLNKDGTYTDIRERLKHIYENGGVIGGSSAGAAVMSEVMIAGGDDESALNHFASWGYDDYCDETANRLRITKGIGIFPAGVIDRHFDVKPRYFRLTEAVMLTRDRTSNLGFGISEDTAVYYDGKTGKLGVIGRGSVSVIDCSAALRLGEPGSYIYSGVKHEKIFKGDVYFSKH